MNTQLPSAAKLANDYVDAFVKNCPRLRMTQLERLELWRLFQLALQARTNP